MGSGTAVIEAVLKAADDWVAAQEALLTAKEAGRDGEAEREAADCAGVQLLLAVVPWRSSLGREMIPEPTRLAQKAAS